MLASKIAGATTTEIARQERLNRDWVRQELASNECQQIIIYWSNTTELMRRVGNDDAAEQFDSMSLEEYAEHRGFELLAENPNRRRKAMARETSPTKAELSDTLDEIAELAEDALDPELSREELVTKVKELAALASGESDEEDGDEEESHDEA